MPDESQLKSWRRELRADLLEQRARLPRAQRRLVQDKVTQALRAHSPWPQGTCVGFYWPIKGEINVRALLVELSLAGVDAALPVVVDKNQPLEFWRWRPGMPMRAGAWRIPIPRDRDPVEPAVLLIPLLGFDAAGYRLGYGGGYYDRTLAALPHAPVKIGVGHELGRLPSIQPQAHDIPMDSIVTEAGLTRCNR